MMISDLEHDALCELANVGMSRAAAQLSELLHDHIDITVPEVLVVEPDEIARALMLDVKTSVAAVWQKLSGDMDGTAILMFPSEDSKALVHSLVGQVMEGAVDADLRAIEYEAMMEIGNIIIASAMVGMADMLGQEIRMSLPNYVETELSSVMEHRIGDGSGHQMRVVIMFTRLHAARRNIEGRMVLLMTVPSAKDLFAKLNELLHGSHG